MDCNWSGTGFTQCQPITPASPEQCGDGLDNDCDGEADEADVCECNTPGVSRQCGVTDVGECQFGTQTCQNNFTWSGCSGVINPVDEQCDGLDNDCNGTLPLNEQDQDNDGWMTCEGDLDDTDPLVNPGQTEACNGIDDDSDGQVDEDFFVGQLCTGIGQCGLGVYECSTPNTYICATMPGGSMDQSSAEISDGVDNNCNGSIDEGFACSFPSSRNCGPANVGICKTGTQDCQIGGTWGACIGAVIRSQKAATASTTTATGLLRHGSRQCTAMATWYVAMIATIPTTR